MEQDWELWDGFIRGAFLAVLGFEVLLCKCKGKDMTGEQQVSELPLAF